MDIPAILVNSLFAGFFAGGMGVILTAPPRYVLPAILCGFAGRFTRGVLIGWGAGPNWSTAVAAAVVVLVAVAILRRHVVSPVVLVSAILPLGAAGAMFNAIIGLMRVSSLEGEALREASVALSADSGKAFTITLAIALGLAVGMALVRLFRGEKVWEGI
jgi:uncharacterized membrane protein YjjB (DUF3815 family)